VKCGRNEQLVAMPSLWLLIMGLWPSLFRNQLVFVSLAAVVGAIIFGSVAFLRSRHTEIPKSSEAEAKSKRSAA
jgi:hypothetical protein